VLVAQALMGQAMMVAPVLEAELPLRLQTPSACQGMLSSQTLACREAPWLKAVELVRPACPKLMQLAWAHPKPSQAAKPVMACPMLVLLPDCPTLEQLLHYPHHR
jgi:hypothetical protein